MSVLEEEMNRREQWCRRREPSRFGTICRAVAELACLAAVGLALVYRTQVLSFLQEHLSH